MRAALIYQHATSERDREIADSIDERIAVEQGQKPKRGKRQTKPAGPRPARRRKRGNDDPDDGAAGVSARVG